MSASRSSPSPGFRCHEDATALRFRRTPVLYPVVMPRAPRWTDDELRHAVAQSSCLKEVCDRLGLRAGGGTYLSLERHISLLGLNASHLERRRPKPHSVRRRWTDDDLAEAVRASVSVTEVSRRLGYAPSGGVHRFVNHYIGRLGLDTSHFRGQGWSKGRTLGPSRARRPLEEILVRDSSYVSCSTLRARLIRDGIKRARCELCDLAEWRGHALPLEFDHVNGDHTDNRLDNLRILCPNCHALTDTWCGRRRRRSPIRQEAQVLGT